MTVTATRSRTASPPGHWESTGRLALALCALVLGTFLASTWGDYAAVAGALVLAAAGLAVVYPDRATDLRPGLAEWAVIGAGGVVAAVLLSSLLFGSVLVALAYAGALTGLAVVASPLLHVGPRRLR